MTWEAIMKSHYEEIYVEPVVEFTKVFEKFSNVVKYVETTILYPLKEKLTRASIKRVMHIDNTTTN
jgi:hypothetical protein